MRVARHSSTRQSHCEANSWADCEANVGFLITCMVSDGYNSTTELCGWRRTQREARAKHPCASSHASSHDRFGVVRCVVLEFAGKGLLT